MGTRSLTFVYDEDNKTPIINMYRQFDGYPTGHGAELAEFLAPLKLVNGFGMNPVNQANGMGCLAAQMVARFKNGVGGFYLFSVKNKDCGQDYVYHVYQDRVVINDYDDGEVFSGTWQELAEFCSKEQQDDE